jgi:hypothetical protein
MNVKVTLSLIVLLALSAAAFFLTQERTSRLASSDPETAEPTKTDRPLHDDAAMSGTLQQVTLREAGQTLLQLDRIQGRWWVTVPSRFPANIKSVDDLLTSVMQLTGTPRTMSPDNVAEDASITLGYTQSQRDYRLGKRLGAGRMAVTIIEGEQQRSYSTDDALRDIFDTLDIASFYTKRFDPPLMAEVGRIEIATPEGESALLQADGHWWIETQLGRERALETPLPGYPGIATYFELFEALELTDLQSSEPANGMASFGLHEPLITARFLNRDDGQSVKPAAYEIHVGAATGATDQKRYVSNGREGQAMHPVFTADTQTALAFAQDATAFRDPRITTTPRSLIGSMAIRNVTGPYTLRFASNGYQTVTSGVGASSAGDNVRTTRLGEKLALQLSQARASEYVYTDVRDLRPLASVIITGRLDGKTETLTVYSDQGEDNVLVKTGDESVLRRVNRDAVAMLLDTNFLNADQ